MLAVAAKKLMAVIKTACGKLLKFFYRPRKLSPFSMPYV